MSFTKSLLVASVAISLSACGTTNSSYESYSQLSDRETMLVKRCSSEAGIPANDPSHAITPSEMQSLTSCIDSNKP